MKTFSRVLTHPFSLILLVTVVWFWPILTHLTTQAYGLPGDPAGAIWSFYDSAIGPLHFKIPQPILLAFEGWGLTKLFGEVAAYNLLSIAAFLLTGWWGYRFFKLFIAQGPALVAALIIAWAPYHVLQSLQHLGLSSIQYLFLLLVALVGVWRTPSYLKALGVGALFAVVVLHDYYIGLIAGTILVPFSILFIHRYRLPGFQYALVSAVASFILVLPFLWPIVFAMFRTGTIPADIGLPVRDAAESAVYSLRSGNFLFPAIDHPVIGSGAYETSRAHLFGSNLFEQTFWMGIIAPALALFALVWVRAKEFQNARIIGLGFIGLGLLFGVSALSTGEATPLATLLHTIAPVFRVWSRFGLLILIGTGLLAGVSLTYFYRRSFAGRVISVICALLISFEIFTAPPQRAFDASLQSPPQELRELSGTAQNSAIAIYPLSPKGEVRDSIYRLWSRTLALTVWNFTPTWIKASSADDYINPFSSATVERLRADNVAYVVLDLQAYQDGAVPPEVLRYYDPDFPTHPLGYPFPTNPPPSSLELIESTEQMQIFQIK